MPLETFQEQQAREKLEALYQAGEDWPGEILPLVRDREWLEELQYFWDDVCDIFPEAKGEGPRQMIARIEAIRVKAEGVGEA